MMRLSALWEFPSPFNSASEAEGKLFNKHVGSSAWWNALTSQGASISPDEFIDSWNEAARDFRIQNNQYLCTSG